MRFSVVAPTYNRPDTLRLCLEALVAQTHDDYEVIVVNDGGSDAIAAMMAQQFPQFAYVRQPNRGPAAARNTALARATGDVVAFIDDDCVAPAHWLAALADGYARHPEVDGVGGYMAAPDDKLKGNRLAQYERHQTREVYGARDAERIGGFECPAGGTNNMSYRRSVLEVVGGFDEAFRYPAGEDADLKWRICLRGHRLLYLPLKMTHLQPYTWRGFRRQSFTRGRGSVIFDRKYGRSIGGMRVALRLAKAIVRFGAALLDGRRRRFAVVELVGGVYGCLGQWAEVAPPRLSRLLEVVGRW